MTTENSEEEAATSNENNMTNVQPAMPFFPPFIPDSDPASTGPRWTKWKKRFENFLTAMNVNEPKRQRALLLHDIGEATYDIFDTLPETGEANDYKMAIEKLSAHFTPKKNIDYEVYLFRQEKQRSGETLDQYTTRLRKLASTCEFTNLDKELKSQIILGCLSSRLRRRALRESALSLDQLLDIGRAMEISEKQASSIEKTAEREEFFEVNRTERETRQGRQGRQKRDTLNMNSSRKCFNCGNDYPHLDEIFPAKGKACRLCQKMNHFRRCCRSTRRNTTPTSGVNKVNLENNEHQPQQNEHATTSKNQVDKNEHPEESSSDDEYLYSLGEGKHYTTKSKVKSPKIIVKIRDTPTEVMIDTGASVDIIDEDAFSRLQNNSSKKSRPPISLRKTKTKVYGFGAGKPLPIIGRFDVEIESSSCIVPTTVYVMQGKFGSLLSYETALALELVKLTINATDNQKPETQEETKLQQLLDEYDDRFHGVGKLEHCQVHLHIDKNVKPTAQPHRRIPFHLRQELDQELTRLEKDGIIEEIHGPTPWVSPLVVVPKKTTQTKCVFVLTCVSQTKPYRESDTLL